MYAYAYITNTCSFGYHDSQSDFKDIVEISHIYVIFTWWISQEEIFCITVTHVIFAYASTLELFEVLNLVCTD